MSATLPADHRRRELAAIHCAARDLGLDDPAYRAMLWAVARVHSAAELDHAGRRAVLDHLRRVGWRPPQSPAPTRRTAEGALRASADQVALICHIWVCLGHAGALRRPDEEGLRRFVQRSTRRHQRGGVAAPEFLPADAARDLIEHLKRWAGRLDVDWRHPDH